MWVITGGAGFIGSSLLWKLNQEGMDDAWVVDRLGRTEKWKNLTKRRFADYTEADPFLELVLKNKLPKIDGIVHLGACSSTTETDASFLIRNNYEFSKTLAAWAVTHKKPFIYASSAATYGDGRFGYTTDLPTTMKLQPLNMYGYSKQLFDLWIIRQKWLKKVTGVKFFNVFGPNEYHKGSMRSLVVKAYEQIQQIGSVKLFKSYRSEYRHGEQVRDFVYVKDAVNVLWEFMRSRKYSGLYNLGAGRARSWNDLARAIFAALNRPVKIDYIEMPDELKGKYQYHTLANMRWTEGAKSVPAFMTLEDSVYDFVKNYLSQEDSYL